MASCKHKTSKCKAEGCTEPCWRCCKTHNPNPANGKRGRPKRKTPELSDVNASEGFSSPQPTLRKKNKKGRRRASNTAARVIAEQANEQDEFDKDFIIPDRLLASAHTALGGEGVAPSDVVKAMGWDTRGTYKNVKTIDEKPKSDAGKKAWDVGVRAVRNVAQCVSKIFFPNHEEEVLRSVLEKKNTEVKAAQRSKLLDLCAGVAYNPSLKGSVERRTARSLLYTALGEPGLAALKQNGTQAASLNKIAQQKARDDWKNLGSGARLLVVPRRRKAYDLPGLELTLRFILSLKHISMLSWGEKNVRLDRWETQSLPVLTRRMTPKLMWKAYKLWAPGHVVLGSAAEPAGEAAEPAGEAAEPAGEAADPQPGDDPPPPKLPRGLQRSSFLRVVRAVTGHNDKLLCAVDYVTGNLVNDPIKMLKRIATDFAADADTRTKLLLHIDFVKNFLKVQYDDHACKEDDNCDTHSVNYGLGLTASADTDEDRTANCAGCKFVPYVINEVLESVASKAGVEEMRRQDATKVVNNCAHKLQLYQGHRLRVAHQQKVLAGLMKDMEDRCIANKGSDEAMVVIDWKMKWLARYHRETTLQHFAKRGISWHGACIHYFDYHETQGADGMMVKEAVRKTVYLDQILEETNKQGSIMVAAMVECMLHQIAKELPHIKKVTLQSDNAGCYRAKDLALALPIVSQNAPKIVRFVHTETQDGKGLIDAHFAQGTRHVLQAFGRWLGVDREEQDGGR